MYTILLYLIHIQSEYIQLCVCTEYKKECEEYCPFTKQSYMNLIQEKVKEKEVSGRSGGSNGNDISNGSVRSSCKSNRLIHTNDSTLQLVPYHTMVYTSSTKNNIPSSTKNNIPSSTTNAIPSITISHIPSITISHIPSSTTNAIPISTINNNTGTTSVSVLNRLYGNKEAYQYNNTIQKYLPVYGVSTYNTIHKHNTYNTIQKYLPVYTVSTYNTIQKHSTHNTIHKHSTHNTKQHTVYVTNTITKYNTIHDTVFTTRLVFIPYVTPRSIDKPVTTYDSTVSITTTKTVLNTSTVQVYRQPTVTRTVVEVHTSTVQV